MRSALEPNARDLAQYMSDLSETAYYAGWMDGLEFELWDAVVSGPRVYGRLRITDEHIAELRRLSVAAGGWIVFDDDAEEMFVPLADWQARFAGWKRQTTG